MGNLSENFDTSEPKMACQCGCGFGTKPEDYNEHLVAIVQGMRDLLGHSIHVNSAARCVKHNRDEKGVKNSAHTPHPQRANQCCAMDLAVTGGFDRYELIVSAVVSGLVAGGYLEAAAAKPAYHDLKHILCGIGVANGFVHIDVDNSGVLPRPAAWRYR